MIKMWLPSQVFGLLLCFSIYETKIYGYLAVYRSIQDIEERIAGGAEIWPNTAPYIAFLKSTDTIGLRYICGGSLISTQYILTAAHCLQDRVFVSAALGIHDFALWEPTRVDLEFYPDQFTIHPEYDLGLMRLAAPIELTPTIQTVQLPPLAASDWDYSYEIASTYGWGRIADHSAYAPTALYGVEAIILPNHLCISKEIRIKYGEICTEGEGGKGTCNGDSGGPLVVDNVLIGITSRGNFLCEIGEPSFYVFVNKFLSWIQMNSDVKLE